MSPRPAVPAVLLCFSAGIQERWHCQRSGSCPPAQGTFITWGWHCLQPARHHAHPSPHACSKIPWVQETPCPDAFTGPHCPTTAPRCHPVPFPWSAPNFSVPTAEMLQSHRARGHGESESGSDEMPRRTLRLAGLVPGLPPIPSLSLGRVGSPVPCRDGIRLSRAM